MTTKHFSMYDQFVFMYDNKFFLIPYIHVYIHLHTPIHVSVFVYTYLLLAKLILEVFD